MESYLQGQDLWKVVSKNDVVPMEKVVALIKRRIKEGKAMLVINMTIKEELLEYIKDKNTPKEAWDTLATLFSKKSDLRLQFLKNELLNHCQLKLTVGQYFNKGKSHYREISEFDSLSKISNSRMRRIIIYDL